MEPKSTSFHRQVVDEKPIITNAALDIGSILSLVQHPASGGVVLFSGEVRDHNRGKGVRYLEYEAHAPIAGKMIREIVDLAIQKWDLQAAFCCHRVGKLEIGESAVVVVTSSPHRKEAYEANQYIIDRVKHEAPIWKKEYYKDGTSKWGNNCNCSKPHPHDPFDHEEAINIPIQ